MLAVVPVRAGELPAGGAETVAECDGRVLLAGEGAADAAAHLRGLAHDVTAAELGAFHPGAWAGALAPALADEAVIVLPGSPDGRDLAPRLAHRLRRDLLAGAMSVSPNLVRVVRDGGLWLYDVRPAGAFVATLQPGIRGAPAPCGDPPAVRALGPAVPDGTADAEVVEVLPPDLTTMDLAEAPRILAGGAGLDTAARFEVLRVVAGALGASLGATRVVTDRGWLGHERQIGTTGVVVNPSLYIAFGISGAVQHTSGLGSPAHVVSVNTDPHCPMMQMSDLAVVADANAVLDELAGLLGVSVGGGVPAGDGPHG